MTRIFVSNLPFFLPSFLRAHTLLIFFMNTFLSTRIFSPPSIRFVRRGLYRTRYKTVETKQCQSRGMMEKTIVENSSLHDFLFFSFPFSRDKISPKHVSHAYGSRYTIEEDTKTALRSCSRYIYISSPSLSLGRNGRTSPLDTSKGLESYEFSIFIRRLHCPPLFQCLLQSFQLSSFLRISES